MLTAEIVLLSLIVLLVIAFIAFTVWGFTRRVPVHNYMDEINEGLPEYPEQWGDDE